MFRAWIFFLLRLKKSVFKVVSVPSRGFLVLKHILKMTHTLAASTEAISIGLNMVNLICVGEKLGGLEDATMRVSVFFNSTVAQLTKLAELAKSQTGISLFLSVMSVRM